MLCLKLGHLFPLQKTLNCQEFVKKKKVLIPLGLISNVVYVNEWFTHVVGLVKIICEPTNVFKCISTICERQTLKAIFFFVFNSVSLYLYHTTHSVYSAAHTHFYQAQFNFQIRTLNDDNHQKMFRLNPN